MNFVHIADMHMDSPFTSLNNKIGMGENRRLEQRKVFKKIIEYIKENNIEYLFISGDLYEQEYIRETSIEYINSLFKVIQNTKIFISPGNHDPFIRNSYYNSYNWNENVHIFKGNFEMYDENDINIYGMGFTDFYEENSHITDLCIQNKNKINILVMHADLNGVRDTSGRSYNPVTLSQLERLKFDYVALGHIHNSNYCEQNQRIVYPGSTISFGFDELGSHGMIVGEITKEKININFVKLDEREFFEKYIEITGMNSNEEVIEKINEINYVENKMYKIILTGRRNFTINISFILKNVINTILKIQDNTILNYNLEKMAQEISLKGFFIKECLKRMDNSEYTREEVQRAIEIGLESM